MAIDLSRDHVLSHVKHHLNARYGKGEVYKAYDEGFYEPVIVHRTATEERRFKEDIETRDFVLVEHIVFPANGNYGYADTQVRVTRHQMPMYDISDMSNKPIASSAREMKYKQKGSIKDILQKEVNGWLKNVSLQPD